MGQDIKEWTKKNLWKTAFKNLKWYGSDSLKAIFHKLYFHSCIPWFIWNVLNPLSANPTKWLNTFKQFVGKLPPNCLSVFDHFVKLALKGLISMKWRITIIVIWNELLKTDVWVFIQNKILRRPWGPRIKSLTVLEKARKNKYSLLNA